MALPASRVNALVTVTRPSRTGPGGDPVGTAATVLRKVRAVREADLDQRVLAGGTRRQNAVVNRLFLEPEHGVKVQAGDLVDWDLLDGTQSQTGVEVRQVLGPVGPNTSLNHYELTAEG